MDNCSEMKTITMLDVFRAMHSMNVEHVRHLFTRDYERTISEKDAKIAWLEKQLSAVYAIDNANDNNDNSALKTSEELKADIDKKIAFLESERTKALEANQRLFNEGREAIVKRQSRISLLKQQNQEIRTKLSAEISVLKEQNSRLESRNAQLVSDVRKLTAKLSDKCSDEVRVLKQQIENQRVFINNLESKLSSIEIRKFTETNAVL